MTKNTWCQKESLWICSVTEIKKDYVVVSYQESTGAMEINNMIGQNTIEGYYKEKSFTF